MWILPRQLHTSPFVPDMAALISDSDEFSQLCAQSLTARGKDSAARIWSAKLKRDSWMQLLFGRTLRPSHGSSFVDAWTSFQADTRASRSQPPASASEPKTQDTSGRLSQPELLQCDQVSVSLKTSRDISALGFPTCCKTWQEWVTERRSAWRARVKLARLTRGGGSLYWPTMGTTQAHISGQGSSTVEEVARQKTFHLKQRTNKHGEVVTRGDGKTHQATLASAVVGVQNWPTANARDWKDTGPTPNAQVSQDGESLETWLKRKEAMKAKGYNGNGCGTPLTIAVQLHGQAAPASSSSLGSRQGLWQTPKATNADCPVIHNPQRSDGGQPNLAAQMVLEQQRQALWATPRACEAQNPPMGVDKRHHGLTHQVTKTWATPRANERDGTRTPNGNPKKDGIPLGMQAQQWATPQAKDHKSGHQDPTIVQYKQLNVEVEARATGKLNPRWVETLMGLPIGWTMPSCTSPQTIAPMSCDSLAMESACQPLSVLGQFSLAS